MQLQLQAIQSADGVRVVRCSGRLVFGPEAEEFVRECKSGMYPGAELVVNLSAVTTIDNHGVGALVGLLASARTVGGDVRLVLPGSGNKAVQVLNLMHVVQQFHVFITEEEAVKSYRRACAVA